MKINKIIFMAVTLCLLSLSTFAQENSPEKESRWSFSTTTDFAYYPASDKISGMNEDHFAPLTGPYSGLEGRITGAANYTIPTPMGENWLVSGATLELSGKLEITPVSVKPMMDVTWTPLPFLVFSAGAQAGTGWNLFGLRGLSYLDGEDYSDFTPFATYFLKWYTQGTFQFDTGAIWEGDWTHVQIMYSYQAYYEYITGTNSQDILMWQCTGNRTNGLCNYQNLILAYQMPLVLSRIGVMCELDGHYNPADYANKEYNGSFKSISISPLMQLTLGEHDGLSILAGFSSRRAYADSFDNDTEESAQKFTSREWYFNRVAISWTHNF